MPERGKKVNDRDGLAIAKFRIRGARFSCSVQFPDGAVRGRLHEGGHR
ncbi:hypothetical protein ACFPOI_48135 [Nonomuraea angiospora]|uniref:Uncharacterized protein n=1 Tax=Nonomuraea angiospora TaxID=46172 RepID=A0ABR9LYE9_9ACTN|nr:hypothetical protein [Nonomuraea angiospora]MBE1585400.1 hypothetical protein [Nonomuraea angiospora]